MNLEILPNGHANITKSGHILLTEEALVTQSPALLNIAKQLNLYAVYLTMPMSTTNHTA